MTDFDIDGLIAASPAVIFSKSYCPYCKMAKQTFLGAGISPLVLELDQRDDGAAIQAALASKTGQRTVPNVWFSGKHVGGGTDVARLGSEGKLTLEGDGDVAKAKALEAGYKVGSGGGEPFILTSM